jgi:hypothetical protein
LPHEDDPRHHYPRPAGRSGQWALEGLCAKHLMADANNGTSANRLPVHRLWARVHHRPVKSAASGIGTSVAE